MQLRVFGQGRLRRLHFGIARMHLHIAGLQAERRRGGQQGPTKLHHDCTSTTVPLPTTVDSRTTSQLARRTQPLVSTRAICEGSEVPWMPQCSLVSAIHITPTGLLGPGGSLSFWSALGLRSSDGSYW